MATKRKTYRFRHGDLIDIEEYHDGNYGAPGHKRLKREKPTKEQMQIINQLNKARRCRHKLLEYFDFGDTFATWTYEAGSRPPTMKEALNDFQRAIRIVRREYKKRGRELFWIRNIERGTKGAWHIHLVLNEIGDTAGILKAAWEHGGIYITEIRKNPTIYDEDFTKLSNYMTKDEHTIYKKENGEAGRPRLKEASYSTSRNMPLKKPKTDTLIHWRKEPKPKKGYKIIRIHEGVNRMTGYSYRRYTMIKTEPGGKYHGSDNLYRDYHTRTG